MVITLVDRTPGVSDEIRARVPEKLDRLYRHDHHLERAEVRFSEERNPRISERDRCDVMMEGHGLIIRAHACGPEAGVALDRVIDKLIHALERVERPNDKARRRLSFSI
ncbi:MAG: ribosome-associated translation inhibitor RaiA [Acidimicrobiales bacterium]|nr:ribosome-associated translation inhibitor RaiA [Acidimicrobiales bacterium]